MSFMGEVMAMDATLVDGFGDPCQYRVNGTDTVIDLNAVVEYELQFYPQFTDVVAGGVIITLKAADIRPQQGDQLTDNDGKRWKILKPLENDGSIVLVSATLDHRAPDLT